jgi:hypothetical protein
VFVADFSDVFGRADTKARAAAGSYHEVLVGRWLVGERRAGTYADSQRYKIGEDFGELQILVCHSSFPDMLRMEKRGLVARALV